MKINIYKDTIDLRAAHIYRQLFLFIIFKYPHLMFGDAHDMTNKVLDDINFYAQRSLD